jgi:HlyD family secretion protein
MNRRFLPPLLLLLAGGAYAARQHWLAQQPFEWSGTLESHTVRLGSRVGGRVAAVEVDEGALVPAGQVLIRLESGDWEPQRRLAAADVALARAQLTKLEGGARVEQREAARARWKAAEASLEQARDRVGRARELAEGGAASPAERDDAVSAFRVAVAQRDAAKQQFEELRRGSRSEDLEAARAQLDAAQARLDRIDVQLAELEVKAPVAGRVEALPVRAGDLLPPNATAATLVEQGDLYARIYVPETQLGFVRTGQEVPVTVDAFPGRPFRARVDHINAIGEFSPRNLQTADERADQVFATRVTLLEGGETLRAGMAAFVRVPR